MSLTPTRLGYRMPAEWEKHQATWLSWPKDPNTFPPQILPAVESAYSEMVAALATGEEVRIMVDGDTGVQRVKSLLKSEDNVSFHAIRTVDVWVRDYGPIWVKGPALGLTKWKFNAWGMKYEDLLPDDQSGERLATSTGLDIFRPGIVLEGGSIDTDGEGTLLTTEQCLLNRNRNPELSKSGIEGVLKDYLGVRRVIWLGAGIEGDDTDGHIDDVARFVAPGKAVVATEVDETDPNHKALSEAESRLSAATDAQGNQLEVAALPMPDKMTAPEGRLPASHANFYIGNSVVLVPAFQGGSDKEAVRVLESAFPQREVVKIDCRALVYGLGTLHCVTQQVPSP